MAHLKQKNIVAVNDMDELETKLELAKAYLEMGDPSASKSLLNNVLDDSNFSRNDILERSFKISGEFSTPNKIAELISVIANIYSPNSIIDICCGSGNILRYFTQLKTVKGLDINEICIQLSKYINPNADFITADTLKYKFGKGKYDLVVGNLPFGARTTDGKPLEVELIKKGLTLLNDNSVAIFIVSEGLLTNSASFEFRQEILSNFALDMVISLPIGIFPYMGVKTSILVLRNGEKNKDVFMPEFKDNSLEIADNFKQHKGDFYFPISKITDRLNRNYYLSIETIDKIIKGHQLKKLSELCNIIRGRPLDRNIFKSSGKYFSFNRKDRDGNNFVDSIPDERCILRDDDIVVCLVGTNNKIYLYKDDGIKNVITQNYAIIRPVDKNKYISVFLQTEDGINLFQQQINRHLVGSTIQHLTFSSLANIEIPLLPLEELNQLVSKSIELSNKTRFYLLQSSESLKNKDYNAARAYIEQAFENADAEENEHKEVYLQNIDRAEELEETNKQLQEKELELEDMMSMFAHKFRSPLDAIIYNTTHDKDAKLYTESANTMRGLLDIFSIISADDKKLTDKIKNDSKGNATLMSVLNKNLNMTLLHLLSVSGMSKIHQHYMNYAKAQGKITDAVSYKEWCDDYFEMEGALQKQWEQEFSALLNQSASLAERLQWLEHYFFKLDIIGFEIESIQFKEYETTESFLFILMNEILVNAFKYYASENKKPVVLEWTATENHQILSCRNPSIRRERDQHKGSGKGHTFLSALARKTGCKFTKPKPQDDFLLEFAIPNQLLLSNSGAEK